MKTIQYPYKIRSHLVTIAPMSPFSPKSTSKLRSAFSVLHFRNSIVIQRFISRANTAQSLITSITMVFITLLTTTTLLIVTSVANLAALGCMRFCFFNNCYSKNLTF